MANPNNPAGRLFTMLYSYRREARSWSHENPMSVWKRVLGTTTPADTLSRLARSSLLVDEIGVALNELEAHEFINKYMDAADSWRDMLLFPSRSMVSGAATDSLGRDDVFESLELIGAFLSYAKPEGVVPSGQSLEQLRQEVDAVVVDIEDSKDIPPDLRRLLLDRLGDVSSALRDFDIGGPGAVVAATERLTGQLATSPEAANDKTGKVKKAWFAAFAVWAVFTSGPKVEASAISWDNMSRVVLGIDAASGDHGGTTHAPALPAANWTQQTVHPTIHDAEVVDDRSDGG